MDKLAWGDLIAHKSNAPSFSHRLVGRRLQGKARQGQSEGKRAATPQNLEKLVHLYKNHMYYNNDYCIFPL